MTTDRRARLWHLTIEHADGTPVGVNHACAAAIAAAGVDSAAITVMLSSTPHETVYASDRVASDLAEVAQTLGEGPCVDALAGAAVMVADLNTPECLSRWPVFAPAAMRAGVRASFALPLQIGGVRLGAMNLYRGRPGALDRDQLADALELADIACALLLDAAQRDHPGADDEWPEQAALQHPEVHQATGMMIVQLGVTAAVALVRLRAHAYATDRRLRDVAGDVVARQLRFHADGGGDGDWGGDGNGDRDVGRDR